MGFHELHVRNIAATFTSDGRDRIIRHQRRILVSPIVGFPPRAICRITGTII